MCGWLFRLRCCCRFLLFPPPPFLSGGCRLVGKYHLPKGDAQCIFPAEIVDHSTQRPASCGQGFLGIVAVFECSHEKPHSVCIHDFTFGGYGSSGFGVGVAPRLPRLDEPDTFEPHPVSMCWLPTSSNASGTLRGISTSVPENENSVRSPPAESLRCRIRRVLFRDRPSAVVGEHEPASHLHQCAEREPVCQVIPFDGDRNASAVVLEDDFAGEFTVEVIGDDLPANGCILRDPESGPTVAQGLEPGDRKLRRLGCFLKFGSVAVLQAARSSRLTDTIVFIAQFEDLPTLPGLVVLQDSDQGDGFRGDLFFRECA